MEKQVYSPDQEKAIDEKEESMDNGWVNVSDIVPGYLTKDPALAIAGDDGSPITDSSVITCDVCQVSVTGTAPFEQHINGNKHKKRLIKESMKKKYGQKYLETLKSQEHGSGTPVETTESNSDDDNAVVIACDVCNKICTGLVPYQLHIKGKSHQKQLRKQNLIEKLKVNADFNLYEKEEGLEDSLYDVMPQVKPFAQCDVCSKKFSGPQALQDHLSSGSHKKALDMQNLSKKLAQTDDSTEESVNPSADGLSGGEGFALCQICEKKFSGPIPYQQHLISDIHQKKMKKLELAEKMKLLSVNDGKTGTFHCKDCERSFCIPEEFEQHLKSSSHTKRKIKEQMVKKLQNEYPEMDIQAATANQDDSLESEIHLLDDNTVLICSVCHKSFSGPESALAHFTSQKHEKAKKNLFLIQQRNLEQKKFSDEVINAD